MLHALQLFAAPVLDLYALVMPAPTGGPDLDAQQREAARLEALARYQILDSQAERVYDDVAMLAHMLCRVPMAAVSLVDQSRVWYKARYGFDLPELPRSISICPLAMLADADIFEVPDMRADPRFDEQVRVTGGRLPFYAGARILSPEGDPLGTVCVLDSVPRRLGDDERVALAALARQTQHLMGLRREQLERQADLQRHLDSVRQSEADRQALHERMEQLRRTAAYDPLTQLFNRSAIKPILEDAQIALDTLGDRYTLLLVDVDRFKEVNDRHGHLRGDTVLTRVAEAIARTIREDDIAGRYGGDEFVVILPHANLGIGMHVAERIRQRVALEGDDSLGVSVSIGVAQRELDDNPAGVFVRADEALYKAKLAGRNCVMADRAPPVVGP